MHVRVVRFTDVEPSKLESMLARVNESDGPPAGVKATGLQVLLDADQGTAVVLQMFESAEDMQAAEEVFDSMDASETPGTRASVDRCEQKLDLSM
ncbi:MAG: hypothetical protein QOJ29_4505 [Thermoleophilaceae bacterium]|nr:hypothetical protein [Thermoleophilaceae bacterium]